jgi:hypothetical protein
MYLERRTDYLLGRFFMEKPFFVWRADFKHSYLCSICVNLWL